MEGEKVTGKEGGRRREIEREREIKEEEREKEGMVCVETQNARRRLRIRARRTLRGQSTSENRRMRSELCCDPRSRLAKAGSASVRCGIGGHDHRARVPTERYDARRA
eukprot:645530-Rhodomonas_salina.2